MKFADYEAEIIAALGIFTLFGFGWCVYLLLIWADTLRVAR